MSSLLANQAADALSGGLTLQLWLVLAALLAGTAATSFAAGYGYAQLSLRFAVRRARHRLSKLVDVVISAVDAAQEALSALENFPNLRLTVQQRERLKGKQARLLDTFANIVDHESEACVVPATASAEKPSAETWIATWTRTPQDETTGLPDRAAFDENLAKLLQMGSEQSFESGLLLIKIDKFSHLESRFGLEGAERFLKKSAGVVLLALREEDLVCRFNASTLAVLCPATDEPDGRRLAEAARSAIRNYHFRLEETGPEVLVTASFGLTRCFPQDNLELALNRAGNAVSSAQRGGRNQLYAHNGERLALCQVG